MQFHHQILENGLEIVAETNPQAQSTALGFFVKTGSRDEQPEVAGVSHFLEHMAFKGDQQYSAEDINRVFDEVGASYNASTSEEITFYYASILPEYFERTFHLLCSMMRPSLRKEDFEMEKQVILEEIGMYEDMPAFALYEQAMARHFSGHPLGQSVLGSPASIAALTPEQMTDYHRARYGAGNLVLAATGNFDWNHLLRLAERDCSAWERGTPGRLVTEPRPKPSLGCQAREHLHQEHVMEMAPAPSAQNPLRYAAEIASIIVGEEGAGRLYWDLIETGRAESADLTYNDFDGAGSWSTYLCCQPENTRENLERITVLYQDFNRHGPTLQEFEQARSKILTRLVLAAERPMGRLSPLGVNWTYRKEYRSVNDDLATLQTLSLDDVHQLLAAYPLGGTTVLGLGPLAELS
jgi:predicted Zn-dependent peptidase